MAESGAEEILRKECVFFVKGKWPEVMLNAHVQASLCKTGDEIIIAILKSESPKEV